MSLQIDFHLALECSWFYRQFHPRLASKTFILNFEARLLNYRCHVWSIHVWDTGTHNSDLMFFNPPFQPNPQ
jgi:hypothetical protein